jgi:uncharacterized protein
VRAVLDPNILIAALLSRTGTPAQLVSRWLAGEFELVASEKLLAELERALTYPKLRARISSDEATAFVAVLRGGAILATDPTEPPRMSADRGDDYLIALARQQHAVLVSGDQHLLKLANEIPVETARGFLNKPPGSGER